MPPFVVDRPIVILGEDVEHERARTFISRVVDDTAVVTICDLRRRRVCARSIEGVACTTR